MNWNQKTLRFRHRQKIRKKGLSDLPAYTKDIAQRIKNEDIFSSIKNEISYKGKSARVIWCYFGHDESDILNNLHYAYSIWAADEDMKKRYFKLGKYAHVTDDIYIWENTSYDILKSMQQPTQTREEYIESYRHLLTLTISLAEQFIYDLQEVSNRTITIETMRERYGTWIKEVKETYLKMSDQDIAPDDLHDWAEEIMTLAGWVLDLALILEDENDTFTGSRMWLMQNAIRKYYESLERMKELE